MITETQLLSPVPAFNISLARDLVGLLGHETAPDTGSLRALRRAGVLEGGPEVWRVVEPLKSQLTHELWRVEPVLYRGAMQSFVHHADNGLAEPLKRFIGTGMVDLQVSVARLLAEPQRNGAFDALVAETLHRGETGRLTDGLVAARLIADAPASETLTREAAFLRGYWHWMEGQHGTARRFFEDVLAGGRTDRAAAIATHLIAVHDEQLGELGHALQYAQAAVALLRALGDTPGLAMALTTLGRIEAKVFADATRLSATEEGSLVVPSSDGLATLDEAVEVASRLSMKQEGIALSNLAAALELNGWLDAAIDAARRSLELSEPSQEGYITTLITLASCYRQLNQLDKASEALMRGLKLSAESGYRRPLARLLNVLASTELEQQRVPEAVEHARTSVELGRQLNDSRHLSHALTTLAYALLRLEPQTARIRQEISEAITAARRYSLEVKNSRGVEIADSIEQRLRQKH